MQHIKYLEFVRLLKELQFIESDYHYQSEVLKLSDTEFFKNVDLILNQFPELKEIYNRRKDEIVQKSITQSLIEPIEIIVEEEYDERPVISEAKKLYREVVKSTHPDKIKNQRLNELYLEATDAYKSNDMIVLYKVCSELNIQFEIPDNFAEDISSRISSMKEKLSFLDNTYTSKWIKSETQHDKNRVVVEFIRSQIS